MYRYKKIRLPDGTTVDEHRLIWEQMYGPIPTGMLIHHKNNNGRDNRIENLGLMSRAEHASFHYSATSTPPSREEFAGELRCFKCKKILPKESFPRQRDTVSGRKSSCKKCYAAYRKTMGW